jgi:superfamily II DNA/RNA helicase
MITLIANQRDILAVSSPGPGVITACVYGIMKALCLDETTEPGLKAIMLLPTRELAIQVYDIFEGLWPAHKIQVQVKISHSGHYTSDEASERFDIVVGTPRKVLGVVQSGALSLSPVRYYMFDEASSLLELTGVELQCRNLCQKTPSGVGARIVTSSSRIHPAMGCLSP